MYAVHIWDSRFIILNVTVMSKADLESRIRKSEQAEKNKIVAKAEIKGKAMQAVVTRG